MHHSNFSQTVNDVISVAEIPNEKGENAGKFSIFQKIKSN